VAPLDPQLDGALRALEHAHELGSTAND
jgi:hypothetical protein